MYKVFNNSMRRFQLESGNKKLTILPGKFYDVADEFAADVTFRVAVAGGDLKVYDDVSAAEKLIKEHEARPVVDPVPPKTIEDVGNAVAEDAADAVQENPAPAPKKGKKNQE